MNTAKETPEARTEYCAYCPGEMRIYSYFILTSPAGKEADALQAFIKSDTGQQKTKEANEYFKKNNAKIMRFDDAVELIDKAQEAFYIEDWQEITEADWWEMLEVLPPSNWHTVKGIEIFQTSERMCGNITGTYARIGKRYFTAYRRTTADYNKLADEVHAASK